MDRDNVSYPKVIAVDFDGCLCENKWSEIGAENRAAINELRRRKADGDKIILWTCRVGKQLDDAVLWCLNRGIRFDAINENLQENKEKFGNDCRKVFAHEYWDDKAVYVSAKDPDIAIRFPFESRNAGKISLMDRIKSFICGA